MRQRLLRLKTSNSRSTRGTWSTRRRWRNLAESPKGLALGLRDVGISGNYRANNRLTYLSLDFLETLFILLCARRWRGPSGGILRSYTNPCYEGMRRWRCVDGRGGVVIRWSRNGGWWRRSHGNERGGTHGGRAGKEQRSSVRGCGLRGIAMSLSFNASLPALSMTSFHISRDALRDGLQG
jgi:hypothetical protein